MGDPQVLVDQIGALLAVGDVDGATALVMSATGAAQELGRAHLALGRQDLEAGARHARKALELGAGAPAHHFLAVAKLMSGDAEGAIAEARKAVGLDSSPRSRSSLGGILLGAGRYDDAIAVLRQVAVETPDDPDVHLNLGNTAAKTADYAEAVFHFARAFALRPTDQRPIQGLMGMYVELGRWMGGMAALDMSRQGAKQPPEIALALDLVQLHFVRMVAGGKFPTPGMTNEGDTAAQKLVAAAAAASIGTAITIARTLLDFDRVGDARRIIESIDRAGATHTERASLAYLDGYLVQDKDPGAAFELYLQALELDATRVDAAINAVSLLIDQNSPAALDGIPRVLDKVAPAHRANPDLLYNEAIFLVRTNKADEARARLERIVKQHPQSPRAERARQALADLRQSGST